jgi:hypothetical protein
MEQVHAHLKKYLVLNRELLDETEVLERGIRERFGDVSVSDVLYQAELKSLSNERMKLVNNPKENKWVTTSAQGDLFNDVPVRVPSVLIINGKPTPYYEASILDGLEWWLARQDHKANEARLYREAADKSEEESAIAHDEVDKLEQLARKAMDNGIDPRSVLYAKETR